MSSMSPRSRSGLFVAGCGFLIASALTDAVLWHAARDVGSPNWGTEAFHICAVGSICALVSIVLLAFGRGWRRIVLETLAIVAFLWWTALVLIGD